MNTSISDEYNGVYLAAKDIINFFDLNEMDQQKLMIKLNSRTDSLLSFCNEKHKDFKDKCYCVVIKTTVLQIDPEFLKMRIRICSKKCGTYTDFDLNKILGVFSISTDNEKIYS